ncbi:MAG: CPBP family intramembrane metalloprotease [Planctomycetes bacterium]|nr:CPBP family intramembrane metalloprotease [Planctomycetota bacterium]MBI3847718.1 CPBP family intramembrane metalloprotease [Planctomycetota bacterium]
MTALVVAYAGTLGGVALTQCVARWSNSEALPILLCASLQLAVGLASVTILGKRAFRRSFAFRPNARDLLLGAGGGLVMFAIGWLYVRFLRNFSGSARQVAPLPSLVWLVVGTIVLAPLIEEWLCRGVIWQATTQLAPEATVIVTTALLFALLHGVSWGVFGLPHRFAGGLVLGWVRRRTGSLVPVIVGHFINNSLSLAVP